jgi:hypothetical protein
MNMRFAMSDGTFLARILCFAGALTAGACSVQSPIEPSVTGAATALTAVQSVTGVYTLTFHDTTGTEVASLPVLEELILRARVTDTSGQPAQAGSVTFEYCSRRGPTNDITRADEAPMAECAAGTARWRSLLSLSVNQSGEAAMNFGFVRIPRTIGFRFKYRGTRNGIASGTSVPRDFVITAQ